MYLEIMVLWHSAEIEKPQPAGQILPQTSFWKQNVLAQSLVHPFTCCLWLPLYHNAEVNSHGKDYVNQKL